MDNMQSRKEGRGYEIFLHIYVTVIGLMQKLNGQQLGRIWGANRMLRRRVET